LQVSLDLLGTSIGLGVGDSGVDASVESGGGILGLDLGLGS
jgi:hypothetical protein